MSSLKSTTLKSGLLLAATLSLTTAAIAAPASPEQILCSASAAIVGTVVESRDRICRLPDLNPRCADSHTAEATVRIDEVLDASEPGFTNGDQLSLASPTLYRIGNESPRLKVGDRYLFIVRRDETGASGDAYPMDREAWVRATWANAQCQRWRDAFRRRPAIREPNSIPQIAD